MQTHDAFTWCPICGAACLLGERCPQESFHARLQQYAHYRVEIEYQDRRPVKVKQAPAKPPRVVRALPWKPRRPWWQRWFCS